MSRHKWFRIVAGIFSVLYAIGWILILLGVYKEPDAHLVAAQSFLALALAWGIIAGFTK